MSVVIRKSDEVVTAAESPYENELELERILADRVDYVGETPHPE